MEERTAIAIAIILLMGIFAIVFFGIHMQIPDQNYCNTVLGSRYDGPFGPVLYLESQRCHDFSLNQSKCIWQNGSFVANPEYSIWGI